MSRERFPDYIWQSLSTFAFACYIAPNNQKVNTVFGVSGTINAFPPTEYDFG